MRPFLLALFVLLGACAEQPTGVERRLPPDLISSSILPNVGNVLSAVLTVHVLRADSVAVRFHTTDAGPVGDSVTPAVAVIGDSTVVPLLGLLAAQQYTAYPVIYGSGVPVAGKALGFSTSPLPTDLPRFEAGGADPLPGFVVFAAGKYGLVIDNTGRVVWYARFANGPGLAFMAEPTGHYAVRPPTPDPTDIEPWLELDALGAVVRTLGCSNGLQPRPHDVLLEADGGYWMLCDETRTMDLSSVGGVATARVTGTVVQHMGSAGQLLFHWTPFGQLDIADADPVDRRNTNVNWTHGNALDVDSEGSVYVSLRNLNEILKIDTKSGAVAWHMGGVRNQFAFAGEPLPPFVHQHGLRLTGPNSFLVLDNIGDPTASNAKRYSFDETTHEVHLVQSHGWPGIITEIGGSVQNLPSGRTLVSFGTAGRVEEYDAAGRVTWRIDGNAGYVFRAQRIQSLYSPGANTPR
jgi:hypothetical protein